MSASGRFSVRYVFGCFLAICCFFVSSSQGISGVSNPTPAAVSAAPGAPHTKIPRYVFLISIDGWAFRHLWSKKIDMPNIRKLARSGVWGDSRTVFPSMTWAAHATIVSGLHPRRHGVLGNRWFENHKSITLPYWDNLEKVRATPTLYDLAHAAQMKPAAVMWPGTQGSKTLDFNLPELTKRWLVRRYVKGKTKRLIVRSPRYSYRSVHRVMHGENAATDRLAAHVAKRLINKPEKLRPKLFLLHFLDVDHAQHYAGTSHRAMSHAAKRVDQRVGEVLAAAKKAGIYQQSTFFLVSDHGFLPVTRRIDARNVLRRAGLSRRHSHNSRTASRERVVAFRNGHAAFIYLKKKKTDKGFLALRRRVSKLFRRIPEVQTVMLPGAYAAVGLPTPDEDAGSPDLIILAKPHAYFGSNSRGRTVRRISSTGAHGYLPNHPGMWVPFVAAGAGIQAMGKLKSGSIHNVDIAPTIAHLLALEWPSKPDGRVLHEIFEPTTRDAVAILLQKRKKARIKRELLAAAKKEAEDKQAN